MNRSTRPQASLKAGEAFLTALKELCGNDTALTIQKAEKPAHTHFTIELGKDTEFAAPYLSKAIGETLQTAGQVELKGGTVSFIAPDRQVQETTQRIERNLRFRRELAGITQMQAYGTQPGYFTTIETAPSKVKGDIDFHVTFNGRGGDQAAKNLHKVLSKGHRLGIRIEDELPSGANFVRFSMRDEPMMLSVIGDKHTKVVEQVANAVYTSAMAEVSRLTDSLGDSRGATALRRVLSGEANGVKPTDNAFGRAVAEHYLKLNPTGHSWLGRS